MYFLVYIPLEPRSVLKMRKNLGLITRWFFQVGDGERPTPASKILACPDTRPRPARLVYVQIVLERTAARPSARVEQLERKALGSCCTTSVHIPSYVHSSIHPQYE